MPKPIFTLTSTQKQYLKGLAMGIKPKLVIGKNGLTENLIKELITILEREELIKIKLPGKREDRKTLADQVQKAAVCHHISLLGSMAVFYKHPANRQKPLINLP